LLAEPRRELWESLALTVFQFSDLGLDVRSSDRTVWVHCQSEEIILVTANRNAEDDDSLQVVIEELNEPASLPVVTISNPRRIKRDSSYANHTADRLLETLFDIDKYLGTGRLFLP
jgi:hypothetical protein